MQFSSTFDNLDMVITPFEHNWDFLNDVRNHSKKTIKILSKNTLLQRFYHGNQAEAVRFLIEHHQMTYEKALTMIHEAFHPLLQEMDDEKVRELLSIKERLILKGIYRRNQYIHQEFATKRVAIFENDAADGELLFLLNKLGATVTTLPLQSSNQIQLSCAAFETLDEEVNFTFQQIATLIADGYAPENITIVARDGAYDYALRFFAFHFSLPLNMPSSISLYTLPLSKEFLDKPCFETILPLSLERDETSQQVYALLKRLLRQYPQGKLSLSEYQDLMSALLKKTMLPTLSYQNGITVSRELPYPCNKPVFILGFNEKTFPLLNKDDDYLPNQVKAELHRNTSKVENNLEMVWIVTMLAQYKLGYITYKNRSSEGDFYPSPLIKELNILVMNAPWVSHQFSKKVAEMDFGSRLDAVRKYRSKDEHLEAYRRLLKIPYIQYSSAFTGVKAMTEKTFLNLSYSKIADYYKCPFMYYAKHVLKLDIFEDSFYAKYGSLAHDVLMHRYQEGYRYDESFDNFASLSDFSAKEKVFLVRLKEELRQVDLWLSNHERLMRKVDVICEKDVVVDIDAYTRLSGRIDKIYITTNGKKTFLFVIDYKTSKEAFKEQHIEYGFSLQLPIYAYFIARESKLNTNDLGGLYIQPILLNQAITQEEPYVSVQYQKAFRYAGVTTDDLSIIATFDSTYDQNSIIASAIMNKDGSTRKKAMIRNKHFFDNLSKRAETKINEAISEIRGNNFAIKPRTVSGTAPCDYCAFRHLCFRKDSDIQYIKVTTEEENSDE